MSKFKTLTSAVRVGRNTIIRSLAEHRNLSVSAKTGFRDLKTYLDERSEGEILEVTRRSYPHAVICAEESKKQGFLMNPDDETWYYDPLDGTTNIVLGLRLAAVGGGIWHRGETIMSAIDDVFHDTMYCANGDQAYCVTGDSQFTDLRMLTHSPQSRQMIFYDMPATAERIPFLEHFMHQANLVSQPARILGSAHLALCYLAERKAAGYVNKDLYDWDVVPALRMLMLCGFRATDWDGNPWQPTNGRGEIIVATEENQGQLLAWAKEAKRLTMAGARVI